MGYKLLSSGHIIVIDHPKSAANAYKWVGKLITKARREDNLPWEAVVDPGRRHSQYWSYPSLENFLRIQALSVYRADIWRGQPRRIEVWVEKDGQFDFIRRIMDPYRIPVNSARGMTSVTTVKDAADRYGDGRGWTLLYVGDHDPTGLDIDRFIRDDLRSHGCRPEIVRVALTKPQALALPSVAAVPLKERDSRTAQYRRTHHLDVGWEMEAMPAGQLKATLLQAVMDAGYDRAALNEAAQVEAAVDALVEDKLRDVFGDLNEQVLKDGLPDLEDVPLDAQRRYLAPPTDEDADDGDDRAGDADAWEEDMEDEDDE